MVKKNVWFKIFHSSTTCHNIKIYIYPFKKNHNPSLFSFSGIQNYYIIKFSLLVSLKSKSVNAMIGFLIYLNKYFLIIHNRFKTAKTFEHFYFSFDIFWIFRNVSMVQNSIKEKIKILIKSKISLSYFKEFISQSKNIWIKNIESTLLLLKMRSAFQ